MSRTQLQLCSTTKLHNNTSSVNRPSRIKPTTTTTLLVVRILPLLLPTAVCILSGRRNLAAKLRLVDIRLIELFVSSFKGRSTTVLLPPFSVRCVPCVLRPQPVTCDRPLQDCFKYILVVPCNAAAPRLPYMRTAAVGLVRDDDDGYLCKAVRRLL